MTVKSAQVNLRRRRRTRKSNRLNTIKPINFSSRNVCYRQQARLVHTKLVVRLCTLVEGGVVTFTADKGVRAGATDKDVRASATLEDVGTSAALKGEAGVRCDRDRIFERRAGENKAAVNIKADPYWAICKL